MDGANYFPFQFKSSLETPAVMVRLLHSLQRVLGLSASPTTRATAGSLRTRSIDTDFSVFRGTRSCLQGDSNVNDRADRLRRGRSGRATPEAATIDEAIEEGRQDTSAPRACRA